MPTYPQTPKELTQEALDKFADTSVAARRAYDELMDAVGYGASWEEMEDAAKNLSPQSRNIVNAIIREDALGFDNPAQALRQIASNPEETLRFYEMNPQMKGALTRATNQGFDLGKAGKALGLFAAPILFMNAQDTYAKGIEAGDSPAKAATRAAVEFGVDAVSPLGLTATEVGAGSDVVPDTGYYQQAPTGKTYYGQQAIDKIEERLGRPLSYAEARVVEEEGFVDGVYKDDKGITTSGVGQTGKYINMSFDETFKEHEDTARALIKDFDILPEPVQAELVQSAYRGDLQGSPTFRKLFNAGKYQEAAKEFLDNDDYRASVAKNKKGMPHGVAKRMESVANAVEQFGMLQDSGEDIVDLSVTGFERTI